jgi:hypothetical protein
MYILGTSRAFGKGSMVYLSVDFLRTRAFFLRKYVNRGMAFHRLVVVASLPATFPTLGRGHPNMTEQAALTRVNLGQQTHILNSLWELCH